MMIRNLKKKRKITAKNKKRNDQKTNSTRIKKASGNERIIQKETYLDITLLSLFFCFAKLLLREKEKHEITAVLCTIETMLKITRAKHIYNKKSRLSCKKKQCVNNF